VERDLVCAAVHGPARDRRHGNILQKDSKHLEDLLKLLAYPAETCGEGVSVATVDLKMGPNEWNAAAEAFRPADATTQGRIGQVTMP
jgi:hypothetical protein